MTGKDLSVPRPTRPRLTASDPAGPQQSPAAEHVSAIEAHHLSVSSGNFTLLSPTDISLATGRSLAIGGENGSGKTTLLSVLTGLLSATAGTVAVCGLKPDDRRSGFRAAVTGLIGRAPISRELTVAEHLEAVAMSWALAEPKAAGLRQLEELEIDYLADRFAHELSSGQTQLMQLAMILVRPARMLVLDEPEQRLDSTHLDLVIRVLEERAGNGTTLVLASHSRRVINRLGEEYLHLTHTEFS